jgi:chitinase
MTTTTSSSPVATPSAAPVPITTSPTLNPVNSPPSGYLSTAGNQMVESTGALFRMTGINWFGFETSAFMPHGLWQRSYRQFIDVVADELGFNTLRLPFCNQALRFGTQANGLNTFANPELVGLSPLEMMDEVIRYAGTKNLRIFLDRHSAKADGLLLEDIWYIPGDSYYTEERWIEDWVMLAARYANNPTVVGVDLFNEPKRNTQWSGPTGWRQAAQRCANAIHAVNPNLLIIVEGVSMHDGYSYWWGGNLRGVRDDPVQLRIPNKLVYSAHDYPSSVYQQQWFNDANYPDNLDEVWRENWGYIFEEGIAPLLVGEFGTRLESQSDEQWLASLMQYMDGDFNLDGVNDMSTTQKGISFTFWCLNPNSGDTGGILENDWVTINRIKYGYLLPSLEPMAQSSSQLQTNSHSGRTNGNNFETGSIVGIVLGSVVAVGSLCLLWIVYKRRQHDRALKRVAIGFDEKTLQSAEEAAPGKNEDDLNVQIASSPMSSYRHW